MSANNELRRSSPVDRIFARLQRVEDQIAVLSERAGVPWENVAAEAGGAMRVTP